MTGVATDQVFLLPDLGEGLTEAEVLDWKVTVGDRVAVDQNVVEVETAKAAVEVPCPYAGEVTALHAEAGTVLEVGRPLITVAAEPSTTPEPRPPHHERHREEEQAGSGNVLIGYGTGHGGRRRRRARVGSAPAAQPVAAPTVSTAAAGAASSVPAEQPRVLSPVVRKLARHHDVDLTTVRASGSGGVIVRADVERAIAESTKAEPSPTGTAADTSGEIRTPLRGLRGAVAEKLSRSRREIPDATTWVDLDATGLVEARAAMRESGADVGLLALLARICVAGLRRFPELNSSVDVEHHEIVRYERVNLGFAAQTDRGLVVPVIRDAHERTTEQLSAAIRELTELARTGGLAPEQLSGGTFTLNNYGVFGVDGSTPIINHPEAALLGIGRIVDKPWAHRGELALRKVTQASLSFDHRVCDGGVAGGFLRYVGDCIENPVTMLSGL